MTKVRLMIADRLPQLCILGLFVLALAVPVHAADLAATPKLSLLIVDGMNNHDWLRSTRILRQILTDSNRFTVHVSTSPTADAPKEAWGQWRPNFAEYDVVLSNFNGGHKPTSLHWPRVVEKSLEDYVSGGGGLVIYHSANNSFPNWPAYNEMIGLGWRDKDFGPSLIVSQDEKVIEIPQGEGRKPGHGPEHDFHVSVLNAEHPITKGLPKRWLHPHEQLTHGQHGPAKNMTVLSYAYSKDTGDNEVMDWVIPYGKGRIYVTMLGHLWKDKPDTAMRCIGFQTLLIRGCEWAATGKVIYPVPEDFPAATDSAESASLSSPAGNGNQDERFRRLAVGTWEDDYQGERTMTLKDDGTGTMVVDLEGVKATLFASRLRFDMKWSVENGRLKKRTIGGEPSLRVQFILNTMGDRVDEPILELTEARLLLLDKDGETKYDWRRVR